VAGGNQNITTTDLDGLTPKAAFFIVSEAVTDGTAANHAVFGIGAATGAANRWSCAFQDEHNLGTTDTNRRSTTDECVLKLNTGDANVDGEADFSAWIENGITINWGNAPAAAYLLTVIFFAGVKLSVHASTFSLGNQNIETNVNTVGFQPDVILTGTNARPFDDAASSQARFSHGVVTYDGTTITQLSYTWNSQDAQAASSVASQITDDYGIGEVGDAGTFSWAGEFSNFDADGFSCTPRLGNSGDDVGFLALKFDGVIPFWAAIIDSPTANGNESWEQPEFQPQYVHLGLTQMAAIDTAYTDSNAGSLGISTFDQLGNEYCNSWQDEDTADPTDTQSLSDNTAIELPDDDGTAAWTASFVSFDASGWTLNFSASEGTAVKWWALALGRPIPRHPAAYFDGPTLF